MSTPDGKLEHRNVYTLREAAEELRVDPRTLVNELKSGHLKGFKVGKSWRITREELWRFKGVPLPDA